MRYRSLKVVLLFILFSIGLASLWKAIARRDIARQSLVAPNVIEPTPPMIEAPTPAKQIAATTDPVFFAIDNKQGIRFDIFRLNNGQWQRESFHANPGDRIGSLDLTDPATNFDTGWTLVDIRDDCDPENKVVVLVNDLGTIVQRTLTHDRRSLDYRKQLAAFDAVPAAKKAAPRQTPAICF